MAYSFGSTTDVATSSSGTSQTLSVTYTAGQRAMIYLSYGTDAAVTVTISDGTNTYALVKKVTDSSNTETGIVYEVLNCSGGTFTITVTLSTAQPYRNIVCTTYTSLDNTAANANNGTNNIAPGSGAGGVSSGTATPGSQPAIVFGYAMDTSGTESSLSADTGAGFTSRGTMANTETAIGVKTRIEDRRVTATTAVAATFTAGSGGGRFFSFVVIVPESGGGGGGGTPLFRHSLLNGLGSGGKFFHNPIG